MKKFLLMTLIVSLLVCIPAAHAGDLGVQVIGGDNAASTPMSLDDMQLGTSYTIDGYAIVQPIEYLLVDCFAQFGENEDYSVKRLESYDTSFDVVFTYSDSKCDYNAYRYVDANWMDSGEDADFVWLRTDVTNLQKEAIDLIGEAVVKVVYQDDYEFNGWIRQIDYNKIEMEHGDGCVTRYTFDKKFHPAQIVLNPAHTTPVDMMYTGNLVFGCTLPNYVLNDKNSPLKMVITLGDNELTYNIRK